MSDDGNGSARTASDGAEVLLRTFMGSDTAISSSMEQELEVQQNTQSALKQRETRAYNLFKLMCNSKGLISKDSLVQAIVREDMVHAQGRGDKNPDEVNEIVQTLLGAMRGHDAANEDVTYAEFLETFRYFNYFRTGYMRGFKAGQVSIEAELDNNNKHTVSDIYKSSKELDFLDFLMLLSEEAQLRRKMEVFKIEQSYRNPKFHTMRDNELSSLEDGIAGSFGGLLSTMIGHPFDTIKVRLQTSVNSQSAAATTLKLLRDEGPLAFFKGLSSPLSAIPVVNALVFASYEKSKHMFQSHYGIEDLSLAQLGVCGGAAGFANCIVIAPVELVRTRLQIQTIAVEGSQLTRFSPFFSKMLFDSGQSAGEPKPAHTMYGKAKYAGPIDCVRSIVTTQGVRGLFTGMFATAIRDVPGYMGQFFAYEKVKQLMLSKNGPPDQELSTPKLLFSGGCGGVFGWAITYPQDIVKSRLQVAKPGTFYRHRIIPDGGFLHCFRHTVKAEGYAGLFKGIGPCLIRAFPVNAASFYGYEWMSRLIKERRGIQ